MDLTFILCPHPRLSAFICGFMLVTLTACQSGARPGTAPVLAPVVEATRPAPAPVRLPADDAPHDNLTEWWYYTGHLWSEEGRRYGFEFVIFQSVRGQNPVGYLSHFTITDLQRGRFRYASKTGVSGTVPNMLDFNIEDWTLQGGGDNDRLAASMEDYALELDLAAQKPVALHGGGYISFGPAGDSYYYSRTRMAVDGRLRDGDKWLQVSGQAWFDHQWGDFVVASVSGWDWYSLQLDDGSEVMLFSLRDPDGTRGGAFGTYVDQVGRTQDLTPETANVEVLGTWASPHTGAVYPSGWHVRLAAQPEHGLPALDLELSPLLDDQELAFERMPYWEGAIHITGTADGLPINGEGYVELTGYQP